MFQDDLLFKIDDFLFQDDLLIRTGDFHISR